MREVKMNKMNKKMRVKRVKLNKIKKKRLSTWKRSSRPMKVKSSPLSKPKTLLSLRPMRKSTVKKRFLKIIRSMLR